MAHLRSGMVRLALAAGLCLPAAAATASTIYVNARAATGGADGASWKTAFPDLQQALDAAALTAGPDEIWVANGTYVPSKIYAPGGVIGGASALNTPHLRTFDLPDEVSIFGGFSGNERARAQRSSSSRGTILSGGGTSWHVVTAGNDIDRTGVRASIEGVTIAGGNAAGPAGGDLLFAPFVYSHDLGGGLYVAFDSTIALDNVQFVGNSASGDGGGVFTINSNVTVTRSQFIRNSAFLRAGALEALDTYEATPHFTKISDSIFDSNSVQVFGGAIVGEGTFPHDASSMDINRSVFTRNTAAEGGAVVFDSQTSTVRNSRFDNNEAAINAGALATTNVVDTIVNAAYYGPAHPFTKFATTIVNCDFNNNVAHGDQAAHDALFGGPAGGINFALGGGALVTYMNGYMNVSDSRFRGNVAERGDGGAILNGASEAQNVFFTGANAFDVETNISNSTFVGNAAPDGNGGAVASLPGRIFTIAERTAASTRLSIVDARFVHNQATVGDSVYAVDSVVTGN